MGLPGRVLLQRNRRLAAEKGPTVAKQTIADLQSQINQLTALLVSQGIRVPGSLGPVSEEPEERADFIEFGSARHASLLGIIVLENLDEAGEREVYESRTTGKMYVLEDEPAALRRAPGRSIKDAVIAELRQKVAQFEAGPPPIPENAPGLWSPNPLPDVTSEIL